MGNEGEGVGEGGSQCGQLQAAGVVHLGRSTVVKKPDGLDHLSVVFHDVPMCDYSSNNTFTEWLFPKFNDHCIIKLIMLLLKFCWNFEQYLFSVLKI